MTLIAHNSVGQEFRQSSTETTFLCPTWCWMMWFLWGWRIQGNLLQYLRPSCWMLAGRLVSLPSVLSLFIWSLVIQLSPLSFFTWKVKSEGTKVKVVRHLGTQAQNCSYLHPLSSMGTASYKDILGSRTGKCTVWWEEGHTHIAKGCMGKEGWLQLFWEMLYHKHK